MASYKHALIELSLAKINQRVPEFYNKLNTTFGSAWSNGPHGIYMGDRLVLARADYQVFLDGAASVKTQVGIMQVEVKPGPDKVLGTGDDTTVITPTAQPAAIIWDYRQIDGVWHCRHCDKALKTEKGIIVHVERFHPEKLEDAE